MHGNKKNGPKSVFFTLGGDSCRTVAPLRLFCPAEDPSADLLSQVTLRDADEEAQQHGVEQHRNEPFSLPDPIVAEGIVSISATPMPSAHHGR